jgi:hypothetical protein
MKLNLSSVVLITSVQACVPRVFQLQIFAQWDDVTETLLSQIQGNCPESTFDRCLACQAASILRESFCNFRHPDLSQCYLTNVFHLLGLHRAELSGKVLVNSLC